MLQKPDELNPEAPVLDQNLIEAKAYKDVTYKILSDKCVEFTKELAQKFITMQSFEGERVLRDAHVEFLLTEAKKGTFLIHLATLISAHCRWDNSERRLNGQHTCWMREYMSDAWSPMIRVLRYEVDTQDDFRKLYSAIDRGAPRTKGHVISARLLGTEQFKEFSQQTIRMLASALVLRVGRSLSGRKRLSPDEIATLLSGDHYRLAIAVGSYMETMDRSRDGRHMWRAPVIAAMFATFEKHITASKEFWEGVRLGVGMTSASDPRLRLRNLLQTTNISQTDAMGTAGNSTGVISGEDMYRWSVHCWNLWRDGETIKNLRILAKRPSAK